MGKVFAYKVVDGMFVWTRLVGKHEHDTGALPRKLVTVFPGDFGGVETPMALASGRLFVPWLNFLVHARVSGLPGGLAGTLTNFKRGWGGFIVFDATTEKPLWQRTLPSIDFSATTVANDVVFTNDYANTIYAFNTQ